MTTLKPSMAPRKKITTSRLGAVRGSALGSAHVCDRTSTALVVASRAAWRKVRRVRGCVIVHSSVVHQLGTPKQEGGLEILRRSVHSLYSARRELRGECFLYHLS